MSQFQIKINISIISLCFVINQKKKFLTHHIQNFNRVCTYLCVKLPGKSSLLDLGYEQIKSDLFCKTLVIE